MEAETLYLTDNKSPRRRACNASAEADGSPSISRSTALLKHSIPFPNATKHQRITPEMARAGLLAHGWSEDAIGLFIERIERDDVQWMLRRLCGVRGVRQPRPQRKPIPKKVKAQVWAKTDGRCAYCDMQLNPFDGFEIDHVHPVCKGGTDEVDNLVPCCHDCNQRKGGRA